MNEEPSHLVSGLDEYDDHSAGVATLEEFRPENCGRAQDLAEYVPVIFARNPIQADDFTTALEENGIPTLIELDVAGDSPLRLLTRRVPVLVPAEMLEEASEMIARLEQRIIAGFDDDELDDEDEKEDDLDDDDDEDDDDEDDDDDL
ncbi:MAG: hypothetical protein IIB54_16405 [Planctomycetes bacterium]|nr:hypothetical protein [Planctomycetota bacterium]